MSGELLRRTSYSDWPILAVPPGRTTFCCADGVEHVGGREALGLHAAWVQVDHDLALLAAVDVGDDGAGDGDELRADEVEAEVVELLLGEALAGEAELQDGHAGGGEVDDQRRQNAGRQLAQHDTREAAETWALAVSSQAPGWR